MTDFGLNASVKRAGLMHFLTSQYELFAFLLLILVARPFAAHLFLKGTLCCVFRKSSKLRPFWLLWQVEKIFGDYISGKSRQFATCRLKEKLT